MADSKTAITITGKVTLQGTYAPLENVKVFSVETGIKTQTAADGSYSLSFQGSGKTPVGFILDKYTYEEAKVSESGNLDITLRERKISAASKRWEKYMESCEAYSKPGIPDNSEWNLAFEECDLKGDLAPDPSVVRRDPSAVIQINGLYYVWYTKGEGKPSSWFNPEFIDKFERSFPWDLCDIWYATSTDGWNWKEKGLAVARGPEGSFDDRSVFTPEIFTENGKYYLVYQAVKAPYVARVKNSVAMAVADSPEGPWRKLNEPVLEASNNGVWTEGTISHLEADVKGDFDSHKVHDPCLLKFKGKYCIYYKGERMGEERFCGEREIKWGVAMADQPEGPYVKSEYNPITNTGHEVAVWPYKDGIAIIQKLDGPEMNSVQFAEDGLNFEMKGKMSGKIPDAFGMFRSDDPEYNNESPVKGIDWGLSHEMTWEDVQGGWMWIKRYNVKK